MLAWLNVTLSVINLLVLFILFKLCYSYSKVYLFFVQLSTTVLCHFSIPLSVLVLLFFYYFIAASSFFIFCVALSVGICCDLLSLSLRFFDQAVVYINH